ncbi:DUF2461 domain-containing protein [Jiulongibacter sediminis]|uniref:TIGR02453 family protein n=1 Tax=Jiulongibacter sediminis TaxID=1605367 RepID=A0A0P7BL02_9BACT|nr:DUF2461 domain-containing protein [Jiulongibacter sediminis]KPM47941.1 hypothetical protein AFM12_12015 [Jiulongibacter sediminis]TBX24124.1 hypothetical protein TK44_12025 [Jiulongibacter sediminis]
MSLIAKSTFQFLKDLKANNDRDWFTENKSVYQEAKDNFDGFIDELIKAIATFDPEIAHHTAKSTVFRIYRDVRFSKDKSPYKTHFGAHITSAKKRSDIHSRSGYYIHIGPGESMLAGGAYMPQGDWLKNIRQEIDYNGADLLKVINDPAFKSTFGELEGESLKRPPKGYDEENPHIELLKRKSFLATHQVKDIEVTKPDFLEHAKTVFQTLKPLGDFLNKVS